MKIIFLDIDGVLCTRESLGKGYAKFKGQIVRKFQDSCVDALNRIVKETGAHIVVSSTWRFFGYEVVSEYLKSQGVKAEIIDVTPDGNANSEKTKSGIIVEHVQRGEEIQAWLDWNKNLDIESFVIIDDSVDMAHLMPKLVLTVWHDQRDDKSKEGLTERKADEAIRMLNEK